MRNVPILTYHFVGDHPTVRRHASIFCHAPVFAAHMRLLKNIGWTSISLQDLAAKLRAKEPLPAKRFALTFDDGDADLHWSVRPVLKEMGFTATVFVVSGYVGQTNDWEPAATLKGRPLLTLEQLGDLRDDGWDIGAHTMTHTDLCKADAERLTRELVGGKADLESALGISVPSFCYPSGCVNAAVRCGVEEAGYSLAVTTEKRRVVSGEDPYRLPRVSVSHRAGRLGLLFRILRCPSVRGVEPV
ncbi:MAG TPA: polysaccharide deacetylase family protein [Armatimonadota bacterium]|jgi:peptidoglycan/xylan/chitin deacetylase (PgdA/CDA1 family)